MTTTRLFILFVLITSRLLGQSNFQKSELKAQASETIETPVLLEEKDLRKINETILNRISEVSDSSMTIKYKVSLSNYSYYTTNDFEMIFKEENLDTRKIIDLQITAVTANLVDTLNNIQKLRSIDDDCQLITIDLNIAEGKIIYNITGGKRDWVLNTQSDLLERFKIIEDKQTYIEKHFLVAKILFFGLLFCLLFVFYALHSRKKYLRKEKSLGNAPKQLSITDYIFKFSDPHLNLKNVLIAFYIIFSFTALLALSSSDLLEFLFPKGVFLIGEQKIAYEKLLSVRQFILNGIIVALLVSILSGIIANIITSKNEK